MITNGIKVDAQAIADGIYEMIMQRGEDGIVSVGMIPKWVHDTLNEQVGDKLIRENARLLNVDADEIRPFVDDQILADLVAPIVKEICSCIYGAAQRAGRMCC